MKSSAYRMAIQKNMRRQTNENKKTPIRLPVIQFRKAVPEASFEGFWRSILKSDFNNFMAGTRANTVNGAAQRKPVMA